MANNSAARNTSYSKEQSAKRLYGKDYGSLNERQKQLARRDAKDVEQINENRRRSGKSTYVPPEATPEAHTAREVRESVAPPALDTQIKSQTVKNLVGSRDERQIQEAIAVQQEQARMQEALQVPAYIQRVAQESLNDPTVQKVVIGDYEFTRPGPVETTTAAQYFGSNGRIDATSKPKGFFKRVEYELSSSKEKLLADVERKDAKQEESLAQGAGLVGVGFAQGAYSTAKSIVRPDKVVKGLFVFGKAAVKDPEIIGETAEGLGKEFARNPAGVAAEWAGGAGVFKVIGKAAQVANVKVNAPKVVGEGTSESLRIDLADDVGRSTTTQQTRIKAGKNRFIVESVTDAVDRPDAFGARLQSSKTKLNIKELDSQGGAKKSSQGIARAESVVTRTEQGSILARGDSVQATFAGDKSFIRQSDFIGVGEATDSASRLTTFVRTGQARSRKGRIESPEQLSFAPDTTKKLSSVETTGSQDVVEFFRPQKTVVDTEFGRLTVETTQEFRNVFSEGSASVRAGSYLKKADRLGLNVDPYAQTVSGKDLSIKLGVFGDDTPKPVTPKAKDASIPSSNSLASTGAGGFGMVANGKSLSVQESPVGFVVSAKKSEPAPLTVLPTTSQSLSAVKDLTAPKIAQSNVIIADVAAKAGIAKGVSLSRAEISNLQPDQVVSSSVSAPLAVQRLTPKSEGVVQSLLDTKTKSVAKLEATQVQRAVARARGVQRGRAVQATKTFTDSLLRTQSQQVATLQTVQVQRPLLNTPVNTTLLRQFQLVSPKSSTPEFGKSNVVQGFDVFVRKAGVFQKISTKALNRRDAFDLGAYAVTNSPSATFDVRPSSSSAGGVSSRIKGAFSAFRQNFVQKNGLFIERREKRIKTSGEKAGITRKGWLALRFRRSGGLF